MIIEIPEQLKKNDFRFIKLQKNSKEPIVGEKWLDHLLKYDDVELLDWIASGGNYGCVSGPGNLRIIDVDDNSLIEEFSKNFVSFSVETPGHGRHIYFISGYDINHILDNKVGEVRSHNYYVVAPNCYVIDKKKKHRGTYNVINNIELSKIDKDVFLKKIQLYLKESKLLTLNVEDVKFEDVDKDFILSVIFPKIKPDIVNLIVSKGQSGERSERDQKVLTHLILHGFEKYIKSIFELYPIGIKYQSHTSPESYLRHSIKNAKKFSGVSDSSVVELKLYISSLPDNVIENKLASILLEISKFSKITDVTVLLTSISKKIGISESKLRSMMNVLRSDEGADKRTIIDGDKLEEFGDVSDLEYWITPIIPKNAVIYIGGYQDAFKSMFIQLVVNSLRKSKNLFGCFEIKDRPSILLYELEMSEKQLARRQQFFNRGMGVSDDIVCAKKYSIVTESFYTNNLSKELEVAKTYDLIIIDSYRRVLNGDESSSDITNTFYREFVKPLKDLGKTVIIIFHFSKARLENYSSEEIMRAFRGSGDIGAEPDVAYGLFKYNTMSDLKNEILSYDVSVLLGKMRDDYMINDFKFRVELDGKNKKTIIHDLIFGVSAFPKIETPLDRRRNMIVNIIREFGKLTRAEVVEKLSSHYTKNLITGDLRALVDDGVLENTKLGEYRIKNQSFVDDTRVATNDNQSKLEGEKK